MPRIIVFILACLFLLMSFFKAWKEQKQLVAHGDSQIRSLQKQIDDLTKSDIDGEIVFAVLGAQGNGSHAGIIANLNNKGAPSAIDPLSWQFSAQTSDGKKYTGDPNTLLDKNLDFCLGPKKTMRFVRKDSLYSKTSETIGRNGFVQGFLWFSIPGLSGLALKDPNTVLRLRAKSIAGQDIAVETTVTDLISRSQSTAFFPGIENPRPLDIPCKENAPY